ncbi:protein kinase [Achlya hypogyna]|uniref:Protein kinase n=1 Tax=Achlya hypogyna TaxID=1202772 RepID=A0A1V9YL62_ACHHY|nr:protein kinase [Achlya hypogyna]
MDCPYIVRLVGANWTRPVDVEAVVEFMDRGDLRSVLSTTVPADFPWTEKRRSILSVVEGLIYLHTFETAIIHRDVKSRNVLLDSVKGTKITDFGVSREVDEGTLTNGIGTYQWMAPEVISGHHYSTAADVYSFGVLLSEYSTHRLPYANFVNPSTRLPFPQQVVLTKVAAGELRPAFDESTTPSWVVELATACLAFNPDDRPTMMQAAAKVPKA